MKLLIDEDSEACVLVRRLVEAGHAVISVGDLGQRGEPDETILETAFAQGAVLLTRNCADFHHLHEDGARHAGILAVYQERDPRKCMRYEDIVHAVGLVEQSGLPLTGQFVCLNQWRKRR